VDVTEATAQLMDDPAGFLARNALTIGGGLTLSSGLRIWTLAAAGTIKAATSGPGWTGTKTIRHWRAQVTPDTSNRPLFTRTVGTETQAEFRAFYVGMKQLGEDVQTTHFMLPATGGPDLMLTSQLTGCTFGVGSQVGGGGCLASHLQPAGSGDGRRAPGALTPIGKSAMRMAVSGPMGPGATILETSGATKISVVGKRTNGNWAFSKQIRDDATGRITTMSTNL